MIKYNMCYVLLIVLSSSMQWRDKCLDADMAYMPVYEWSTYQAMDSDMSKAYWAKVTYMCLFINEAYQAMYLHINEVYQAICLLMNEAY
jgi:hypothetical protein